MDEHVSGLEEMVVSAIAAACNIDRSAVSRNNNMQDLGVDSVNMTSIVAQLQATYHFQMDSDELIELFNAPSIGDFVALLSKAVQRTDGVTLSARTS